MWDWPNCTGEIPTSFRMLRAPKRSRDDNRRFVEGDEPCSRVRTIFHLKWDGQREGKISGGSGFKMRVSSSPVGHCIEAMVPPAP